MSRRVAVVGAGVAGLTAAYELARAGRRVDVYERWPGLGGQAATLDVGGGTLLERYYHHLFTSDRDISGLCDELGVEIDWLPSSVAFFADGASRPFTNPADLLRYTPLSLRSRLRMGLAVLFLQRWHRRPEPLEAQTAQRWIVRAMGREAWDEVWGPLLGGKFGDRAEEVTMAWLWSRFRVRRRVGRSDSGGEVLGYPRNSFESIFQRLREEIETRGGRVMIDRPAARIGRDGEGFEVVAGTPDSFRRGHDPRAFERRGEGTERYAAVLSTVPNGVFEALLAPPLVAALAPGYVERLRSVEYHAALCLLLELDRRFSPFYWINVADRELPFIGLIEQTNFVTPERYGGRHFLYVANYVAQDDPLLELSPDALLERYEPGLRRMSPGFDRSWVRDRWLHREPDAQPIVTVGYRERIPPLRTGVRGLILANTTQVYPEDRGTNYAVRLGREAAAALSDELR